MFFVTLTLFGLSVIAIYYFIKSGKPLSLVLVELKYEVIYYYVGLISIYQDFRMRKQNKTELPLKSDKIAVITGGTRGIGLEVIKLLLECDMNVIMGCRNVEKVEYLLDRCREEGITGGEIEVYKLDMTSQESIKSFAQTVSQKYPKIDILINNAGIMYVPYSETPDGFESQIATNYIGHFLLTHLLLKQLKAAGQEGACSRIVSITSCVHECGKIDFDDFNCKKQYVAYEMYAQTKLCQLLFSNYVNKLMQKEGSYVESYGVHPGVVNTELFNDTLMKHLFPFVPLLLFKNPENGAIPIVWAAVSPAAEGKGGSYINNCTVQKQNGLAASEELQEKLFEYTKDLLKIETFGK